MQTPTVQNTIRAPSRRADLRQDEGSRKEAYFCRRLTLARALAEISQRIGARSRNRFARSDKPNTANSPQLVEWS